MEIDLRTIVAIVALILSVINMIYVFRRPKLKIIFEDDEPFKKHLWHNRNTPNRELEIFARIKVVNKRRKLAKRCTGKITHWLCNDEIVKNFDPIVLHWVSKEPSDYSEIDLAFREFEYLDVFFTLRNQSRIRIYTNTHPRGIQTEFNDKDKHVFKILIYSENALPKSKWFKTEFQQTDPLEKLFWISMKELSRGHAKKYEKMCN